MTEAIKLAIEKGGYEYPYYQLHEIDLTSRNVIHNIVLDPLFWQALGKALGSDKQFPFEQEHQCPLCGDTKNTGHEWWLWKSHRYFSLLMTGGDTENFWKDLLANPKDSLT